MGDEIEITIQMNTTVDEEIVSIRSRERESNQQRMEVNNPNQIGRRRVILSPREDEEGIITLSSGDEEEKEVFYITKESLIPTAQLINGLISQPCSQDASIQPSPPETAVIGTPPSVSESIQDSSISTGESEGGLEQECDRVCITESEGEVVSPPGQELNEDEVDQEDTKQPASSDEAEALYILLEQAQKELQVEEQKNQESEVKIKKLEYELYFKTSEVYVLKYNKEFFWNQKLSLQRKLEDMAIQNILFQRKYNELLRNMQGEVAEPSNESRIRGNNNQRLFAEKNEKEAPEGLQLPGGVGTEDGEQGAKKKAKIIPPNSSNEKVNAKKKCDGAPIPPNYNHQEHQHGEEESKEKVSENEERVTGYVCGMTFNLKPDRAVRAFNAHLNMHVRQQGKQDLANH